MTTAYNLFCTRGLRCAARVLTDNAPHPLPIAPSRTRSFTFVQSRWQSQSASESSHEPDFSLDSSLLHEETLNTTSPPLPTAQPASSTSLSRGDNSDSQPPFQSSLQPSTPPQLHSSLSSFLRYAHNTSLPQTSTVYTGTLYEYTVLTSLARLSFTLTRTTRGAGDLGIDLTGTWSLPSRPYPLRVLVQCKALAKKLGPQHVRELEGAFIGAPVGYRGEGVIGVLAGTAAATKGVREALSRSRWPLVWICVDGLRHGGKVRQMLWNERAVELGLEGIGVSVKRGGKSGTEGEVVLLWNGVPVPAAVEDGALEADLKVLEERTVAAGEFSSDVEEEDAASVSEEAESMPETKPAKKRGRPRKVKDSLAEVDAS